MNSIIQCLSNTRVLQDYILRDEYQADLNTSTSVMNGTLINAFCELMGVLWKRSDESERALSLARFRNQIQSFAPRFSGCQQQDAHEFLRYLLEGLYEEVNSATSRPKPIVGGTNDSFRAICVNLFVGQLKSTLRCTVCGHSSVTFDPF